ncbi:calcium/sodium antiporter [Stomatohabitans albus]|uniref:calcium/sodium antiporter n=1 Tax=Stomatohabitans albus TaxID=3110766 RepID=UPI00300C8451
MLLAFIAVIIGLGLLVWSADAFVDGASAIATHLGMPPLLIGMVIVGFGTSAPELVVSVLAASQQNSGIAIGNAFGSNIANIGLILGLTALITPIAVKSSVLRKELPLLLFTCALAGWVFWNGDVTRWQSVILLTIFAVIMGWSIWQGIHSADDTFGEELDKEMQDPMPLTLAIVWLVVGLAVLVASSRIMVWGAVEIAKGFGVSDLVIGLTIVAVGTSLPELASSLAAIRKQAHDIVVGNVLGSNLFNTLAVVGLAGSISPLQVSPEVLVRDIGAMTVLTLTLFIFGYGFRGAGTGRINRIEGAILLCAYVAYTSYLIMTTLALVPMTQ